MHRARLVPSQLNDYDWYRPLIRFAQVPRDCVDLKGSFSEISKFLVDGASANTGVALDHDKFAYVPIHELQIPSISKLIPSVVVLPADICLQAFAQSSIR